MRIFFKDNIFQDSFALSSEESKHIAKAMRLRVGDEIWITDGKGTLVKAALSNVLKECCEVEIIERFFKEQTANNLHLAVAPTKNADRMEWLVEKAVELGVSQISFIICERSERKQIDLNRLYRIAVAALKQSQGTWLPEIKTISFAQCMQESRETPVDKFIAYCEGRAQTMGISEIQTQQNILFLIGPEGDFTPQELLAAQEHGFQHISFGEKILRTETAALLVACWFTAKIANNLPDY